MLSLAAISTAEKLFYVDCGPEFNCNNAKVYYVNPSSATPKATLFETGVFILPETNNREFESLEYSFQTGTLDLVTYQITNIKTSNIFYFKGGKIWVVDTETLTKRRLSNASGITPETLCDIEAYTDWMNPNNSTIYYRLKGLDGQCDTGDDISRVVKVGMTSTTPPINIPNKNIRELLLDGRYLVENYSSYPWKLEICSSDLSSCKLIDTFTDEVDPENFDKQWIILIVNCELKSYDYISEKLYTLYEPPSGECVGSDGRLDRDDYVYFQTQSNDGDHFTNSLKKVPVNGGSVQILTQFTTDKELDGFDLEEISSTHVVYLWRISEYSDEHIYSVPKGGGIPVVISDSSCVEGGSCGQYYFCEDKNGNVWRVKLDGTQRIKRANSQLNGGIGSGSEDWFSGCNPSTERVLISDISNNLKSYAINEDFRNPTKGISIGTVPVNLSNFRAFSDVEDSLGIAMKRFTGSSSFGTDILLLKATIPSSLKRLSNTNGWKIPYTSD